MQKVTYILKCQITDVSWYCSQPVSTLLGWIKLKYPSTNSIECQYFKCIRSAVRRNISVKEDTSIFWNCPIFLSVPVIFKPFDKFWVLTLQSKRKATKRRIIMGSTRSNTYNKYFLCTSIYMCWSFTSLNIHIMFILTELKVVYTGSMH